MQKIIDEVFEDYINSKTYYNKTDLANALIKVLEELLLQLIGNYPDDTEKFSRIYKAIELIRKKIC